VSAALPDAALSSAASDELDLVDWRERVDREVEPAVRHRLHQRRSRPVELLTQVHSSALALVCASTDFVLVSAVAASVRVAPPWWAPLLWYPGQIVVPMLAAAAVAVAGHATTVAGAVGLAAAGIGMLTLARGLSWLLLVPARRRGFGLRRTLLVADAAPGALLWKRLVEFPEAGLLPVELIDYASARRSGALQGHLRRHAVEHVVLVTPGAEDGMLVAELPRHERGEAPYFSIVPALSELFLDPRSVSELGGIPLIPLGRVTRSQRRFPGKRAVDLVFASVLLVVGLPLLAAVAIAIKLCDGGPVFYRQTRVGRHGQTFSMLKFRSMVVGADRLLAELRDQNVSDGLLFKLRDDPRVTRVGRWLRRTSIDELPQLWHVVRGEMSLVGPRPLAVSADDFADAAAERHTVLPGMTGYWQLSGGSDLTYDEMVRLDLSYIRNWSLWLDLRLLLRTVPVLLNRRHGA
jgi:exopolysaccharide biosynthesis polyprenyl glycosylphosphotransferase